jgi:hypothetical protein
MQVIRGTLRMRGGGKDQPLVVLQGLEPVADIGGVILANLGGDFEIGAEARMNSRIAPKTRSGLSITTLWPQSGKRSKRTR